MPEKTRILFVDDEPLVLQGLQRQLRNMRGEWDMVFVDSGPKGLEALAQTPFEVVVTDMRMPGMNGAEFLAEVMARFPSTIRLVLSGHADQDLILKAEGAAHQFLAKPCDPELLRTVILGASEMGSRLRNEEIRRVLGGINRLPVLPAIYAEIMELLNQEDASIAALGHVVSQDPAMTVNLLKLVNSAYFGLRQEVSDPGVAVSYLGVETLKALALFHGVFIQFKGFPPGFNAGRFWSHSLDLGLAAREIAKVEGLGRAAQSESFTGGLIHDVGLLILASRFPEAYQRIAQIMADPEKKLQVAEHEVLGVHHGEVGAFLLGLWGLPRPVVEAVADHHTLPASPEVTPALIVHAAEALSTAHGDAQVFGLDRAPDLQFLSEVLGPRLEVWQRTLDQGTGGTL